MLEKYVEEKFPRYFHFGVHPNGVVDVASKDRDTVATVVPEHLKNLIEDRDAVLDMLVKLAIRFDEVAPEEFNKVWYE